MNKSFELSLNNLSKLTAYLQKTIAGKDCVVLLQGDLASGKTTLVQEYLKSLNLTDEVTSPTFCLQNIYEGEIYHYDIYNKTLEEFISLGLLEEFEKEGIHFVEWGDETLEELLRSYGFEILIIKIEKLNEKRRYTIYA
ncbi:MAG: tRNA (adenosine(37)-N6)-threonylcarbamoyltransferase complex ATPase subunit type 1 TsaE [Candidatus Marinarcus sp.]|uniref:tRNA (adenosine(37)-N6)-threonylcarbamoyltransferase complex ATPase subunit type 1 TsaE n=1 Tax=Candidatus Marinarcus sp. TaxID=3100987 RepID=UPI003B00F837